MAQCFMVPFTMRYNEIRLQGTVFQSCEKWCNHWEHVSSDIKMFESYYLTAEWSAGGGKGKNEILADAFNRYQELTGKAFKHYKTWERV